MAGIPHKKFVATIDYAQYVLILNYLRHKECFGQDSLISILET